MAASAPQSPDPVPNSLRVAAGWSWRILVVLALIYVLSLGVLRLRVLVLPLFVGLILTALLAPLNRALLRLGASRALAAAVGVLVLIGVVVGVGWLVSRSIAGEFDSLRTKLDDAVDRMRGYLVDAGVNAEQLDRLVQRARTSLQTNQSQLVGGALATATIVGEILIGLLLALFSTFFFLKDGPRIWGWVLAMMPHHVRDRADLAGQAAWVTLAGYARGTVAVAAIDAVGIGIAVLVLRVPLAMPLILLTFFGAFIPVVGAVAAGAAATAVALVTHGPVTALIMLGAVVVVQQVEAHLLQPIIMSKAVSVHPLAVVLSVTAGSILGGIGGAVIAVPLVAAVNRAILTLRAVPDEVPAADVSDAEILAIEEPGAEKESPSLDPGSRDSPAGPS